MKIHTFQVPDLPVMIAVVEDENGWFGVGLSVSPREKYKPDLALNIAITDARRKYHLTRDRKKARELYRTDSDYGYLDSRSQEHVSALGGGFHALDP